MSIMKRIAVFVFSIYGFFVFLLLMFLLLPFFLFAFLLPRPADGNLVYRICYVWADVFFLLTGNRYRQTGGDPEVKAHSYVIVTNHISYMDIPMMIMATKGMPVRILGKAEMGKIPVFGFIYNAGAVTVKRDSPENRRKSLAELKQFLAEKISILICPEGTFNMTHQPLKSFYDGAFRIAIELQKPVLPIIFPDTYDRLHYRSIFSLTPGINRAVFLDPIPTTGMTEDDIPRLKQQVFRIMEQRIIELDCSWIRDVDHGKS